MQNTKIEWTRVAVCLPCERQKLPVKIGSVEEVVKHIRDRHENKVMLSDEREVYRNVDIRPLVLALRGQHNIVNILPTQTVVPYHIL